MIQDLAGLLWVVNLGCIDLNPWYARCDDADRPDYLHFDLDPTPGANSSRSSKRRCCCAMRSLKLKIASYPKTTGSRGIHVYIPIVRGPGQKQVWKFAKAFAKDLEAAHPKVITAEYRVAKRPEKHVLVDYNQNAWGRTLASVYSVRPKTHAPGFHAGPLGGSRERHRDRGFSDRQRAGPRPSRGRSVPPAAVAAGPRAVWKNCCEAADRHRRSCRWKRSSSRRFPPARNGSTNPSGMASAAWRFATAKRSSCSRKPASRSPAISRKWWRRSLALERKQFVLDGELIVPLEGQLSFDALLQRIHPAASRVDEAIEGNTRALRPVRSGGGCRRRISGRRSRSANAAKSWRSSRRKYLKKSKTIELSTATRDIAVAKHWLSGLRGQLDGVVCKRVDEAYISGERAMLKVKNMRSADCVVGGFRYASAKKVVGSLLLGLYDKEGRLNHVGFTSSIPLAERDGADEETGEADRAARLHRRGARRPEPLEHRTIHRMAAAQADARGRSAVRPLHRRAFSSWNETAALASG